jgi:hypothetical protein
MPCDPGWIDGVFRKRSIKREDGKRHRLDEERCGRVR